MHKTLAMIPVVLLALAGCGQVKTQAPTYQTVASDPTQDPQRAKQLNAEGLALLKANQLQQAEAKLKAALAADVACGPAHNNLGAVYLRQHNYYLAAWEFQYAAKLMPDDPRPRSNLGLVFESTGQFDKAADNYGQALALAPDDPRFIGELARTYARSGQDPQKLRTLLSELVAKDTRPDWVNWARQKLSTMGGPVQLPPMIATQPATAP